MNYIAFAIIPTWVLPIASWSARANVRHDVISKEDEAGTEKNMHELRFKQQQETEAVKQ